MTEDIAHYGVKRRSGRYPWGSGKDPYQDARSFAGEVARLRKEGLTEKDIAEAFGMNTAELRAQITINKNAIRKEEISIARAMQDRGMSVSAIARQTGMTESTVRNRLKEDADLQIDKTTQAAKLLKEAVDKDKYIDYGLGVAQTLQVSDVQLKAAVAMLKEEGYESYELYSKKLGTVDKTTTLRVLAPPGVSKKEVFENMDKIKVPGVETDDAGNISLAGKPVNINPKRVKIRYAEDGGEDMDGVIELRRGVKDLDLGGSNYAQVRIAVGGTHYLKGMAVYADDLPDGVDIRFNTNKTKDTPMMTPTGGVLKPMKRTPEGDIDPDMPFGAAIRVKRGSLNIVNDEGDWDNWSRSLSSQFLSKQSIPLAKQQLKAARDKRQEDLDEILSLTNPTIRRRLLKDFAESADGASVDLKAAALPRQASQVILPVKSMRPGEVYAPNYKDGERVVLVRHPHGGTFEIPELVVNNKNPAAKRMITPSAKDAIGIHPSVAGRLSGADFDGDSVLVIPVSNGTRVKTSPPLRGLEGFDPKKSYPAYEGMKVMSDTQMQMGKISNLITDMTIKGASSDEIARAVRHSMVVIDAEKHKLNYKQSEIDNNIAALKQKYQSGGASTLISRAKSTARIAEVEPVSKTYDGNIDPKTGRLMTRKTGRTYTERRTLADGTVREREVQALTVGKKLALTSDAHTLSSGTPIERVYADHSNALKRMAERARQEYLQTPSLKRDPAAAKEYAAEVASLKAKVAVAEANRPRERQAQIIANGVVKAKIAANPDLDKKEIKKLEHMALTVARARTGARKKESLLTPTDREWEAIQKGAISNHMMERILDNSDTDYIRALSMPRSSTNLTSSAKARIRTMSSTGRTVAEIAEAMGVSPSTVREYL